MLVSNVIANALKKAGINDIFMLTGYGSMFLNDAIEQSGIKFYAARNEAAAPMMAEAYVDSAPIIVISGQVENTYTADNYKKLNIRTIGTAEFSITRLLKNITKYSVKLTNPRLCLYEVQKALHIAKSGRPGPVWIEIPLDIQSAKINNILE